MANNEETTSSLSPSSPSSSSSSSHKTCVLACGYRHVFIPKSGNRFPAWLVQIVVPENGQQQQHTSSTAHTTPATSTATSATTKTSVIAVWRSKRDFLRLSRSTSASTSGRIVFPKRALTKLADAAPWKRPPDPIHTGRDNLNAALVNHDAEGEDQWKVSMKKNLFVLDRFLQQTAEYCQTEGDCNTENSSAAVQNAWAEFCRPTDCEDLGVVVDSLDSVATVASSSIVEAIQRGNALGQYFCSKENADQLVECLLQAIKRTLPNTSSSGINRKMLIVEPSCGHGTVIDSLRQQLQLQLQLHLDKSNDYEDADVLAGSKCQIIGLDIDEEAISYCQKSAVVEAENNFEKSKTRSDNISVSYHLTDFLATNDTFTGRWTTTTGLIDTTATTAAVPPSAVPVQVFMIGGPPYSAGQGTSGDDWHGTLPMEFVEHAVHQWKAAAVAFLMPARCRNATYCLPADYRVETIDLKHSSQFYFQGGKKSVTQPSIIQVFWKAETNKETETGSS
jgi:hypothetical protein